MTPPRLGDLRRCRRGAAALDFAMVSIVFLPLCFGIIELGIMLWVENTLQTTATVTARCVSTANAVCSNAQQYAVDQATAYLPSGMVSTGDVTVSTGASCNSAPGTAVIVTIAHTFWETEILPPPYQSLAISVSSCFTTAS
jgi:Flp pilus assembly protein TadG